MFLTLCMAFLCSPALQVAESMPSLVNLSNPVEMVSQVPVAKSIEAKTLTTQGKPVSTETVCYTKSAKQDGIGILRIIDNIGASFEDVVCKIREYAEDKSVKGVLLVINSGGGSIGSSELICREIKELAAKKPVVALAVNSCNSGAYWVAIAADWIVAQASTSVGSIGVKYTIEKGKNFKQTSPECTSDVDITVLYAGKCKGIGDNRTAPLSSADRAIVQEHTDLLYEIFTSFVAQARGLSLEKLCEWADGKEFTGVQALKLGLIDQIGSYSDAVRKLEELIVARGTVITNRLVFID